jgi:hypothetical protein
MHFLIQYLKHVISANNQHGVHSPFVYNYISQCLYAKPKFKVSKSENVVLKSIPYFSIKKLKISAENSQIENQIEKEFGLKISQEAPFDCIYTDNPSEDILAISSDIIHNNTMILMGNIHRNKKNSTIWKTLKQNEIVTVSIDMFHCGALFFRKEQVKEHFKIRI